MNGKNRFLSRSSWLETAMEIVRSGRVVALPYERLFGLAANALSQEAVDRVCAIKKRPSARGIVQPISVILPDAEALRMVSKEMNGAARFLADSYWPGPLTLLVEARSGLPSQLVGPGGLIGVRVAGTSPAAELAKSAGIVLTATSANMSGERDAFFHEDVAGLEGIDAIVEGRVPGPPGSTVVDCSGETPRILRQGCVIIEDAK